MTSAAYMSVVALTLVVIGAINWALVGLLDFNLISYLFGPYTPITRFIYTLMGLAGLYLAYNYNRFTL